jgi:copper(I)-binding protein
VKNSRTTFASCANARTSALLAVGVAALIGVACAPKDAAPDATALEARDAWARPADSGAMSAVYFTLGNAGSASDTLTGVSSGVAERTELHVSTQHGGTMHMSQVTSLPVPADDSVSFRPLGAHVMLMNLRRPLAPGDTLSVALSFQSGRTVEVKASVRQP